MKEFDRTTSFATTLGFAGVVVGISLCAIAWMIALSSSFGANESEIVISGGFNVYADHAVRYGLVGICFALWIFVFRQRRLFLLATGLIPLAVILIQAYIQIVSKNSILRSEFLQNRLWFEIGQYADLCILILSLLLTAATIHSIAIILRKVY